jgi:hypothetical protein
MRVSLAQPRDPRALAQRDREPAPVMLGAAAGPRVVLGAPMRDLARPIVPTATTLFAPRGAALAEAGGPLVVADTGHHRILIWHRVPTRDGQAADVVLGQPTFAGEARNAGGAVSATSANVPVGVAIADGMLAVADSWNHRVLLWWRIPSHGGVPPDVVLGQRTRAGGGINRGGAVAADTLYWCSGVAFSERGLIVADTGNRRVLLWETRPEYDGAPADRVLGQADFTTRDENAGAACGGAGMRWPHDVLVTDGMLVVADAGNNRVMIWGRVPDENGAECDLVFGQTDAARSAHNGGAYWPTAATLNMPYGCALAGDTLVVADTANSRLTGWQLDAPRDAAFGLLGQPDFLAKGDNRWGLPARDSLSWPYGVAACERTLVIADSGNSRVVLWDLA